MKKLFIISLIILSAQPLISCTSFLIHKNGQLAFGRNFDWVTDVGMICTNLRGLAKTSLKMPEGATIKWVSKYGSLTFNQYGKEFPMGGMNEKGLVVEMMWLDGSQYPKPDKRPSMYVLQWIQYQLDNCASVKEVIATHKKIRISRQHSAPVHYLVADASGDAATIEFLGGKLIVQKGNNLPLAVLSNTAYATASRLVMEVDMNDAGDGDFTNSDSYSDNSVKRFASACAMVKRYQQTEVNTPIVDYSFQILDKVNQPDFTKWSVVYDINNRVVHFKSASHPEIKSVAFTDIDMSCMAKPLSFDINQSTSGSVAKMFMPLSDQMNETLVSRAVEESKGRVPFPDDYVKSTITYAATVRCSTD